MDNANPTLTERRSSANVNGSVRRSGGGTPHRSSTHTGTTPSPAGLAMLANTNTASVVRPMSLLDSPNPVPPGGGTLVGTAAGGGGGGAGGLFHIVRVIVNKVEGGYGMKVSGDNPVFVQSVKPGGAAEKAGLHAGDKIMEVNGENVVASTHTEVVALIRASSQVILTVQKRTGTNRVMGSPNQEPRPHTIHSTPSNRITAPEPVDNAKQHQLNLEKEQYYKLMIEKEQCYMDTLRSDIARSPDEKKCIELEKTENRIRKVQNLLQDHQKHQNEQYIPSQADSPPPPLPSTPPPKFLPSATKANNSSTSTSTSSTSTSYNARRNNNNGNGAAVDADTSCSTPPPLPKRNRPQQPDNVTHVNNNDTLGGRLGGGEDGRGRCSSLGRNRRGTAARHISDPLMMVDNALYLHHELGGGGGGGSGSGGAPPLPPRHPSHNSSPHHTSQSQDQDAANSINKQLSYPLVATCATIINNYSPNQQQSPQSQHTHQRTKSSPESLAIMTSSGATGTSLLGSESMNDLSSNSSSGRWRRSGGGGGGGGGGGDDTDKDTAATPPGTPPPPYPSPLPGRRCYSNHSSGNIDDNDGGYEHGNVDVSSPDVSPLRGSGATAAACAQHGHILANSSPIHAANPQTTQQSIMSMEDEDISDQEAIQLEDHGLFKSLSKLWESTPHLAVFMNYILSNSDPNSLLFYLLTDLYKEGNTKEMRKWAYEIHSCFLVPGAPLRLGNVDEQIALEIDDVLQREYDKEEIMRRIFWKARTRAKEELHRQLTDFQQKRTAGLSTMYGPLDAVLTELRHDKVKEVKTYEAMLINKLEPYLRELEEDNYDPQKYIMAAALTTVVTRVFGVRPASHDLERCPTFVNKEKSFRTKFGIGRFSRKLNIQGHQFVAQQYFTVIRCNNCHQIIYGIGPQGYECSACHINLHRHCVKLYDDSCPGPINIKKDRGMMKIIDRIKPEKEQRRKPSANFLQMERESCIAQADIGETAKPGNPVTRTGSDRRPDAVREETQRTGGAHLGHAPNTHDTDTDTTHQESSVSLPASSGNKGRTGSNINRSESVKEHQAEKQRKKPRNRSDPQTRSDTGDQQEFSYTNSGSSSSSSSHSLRVSSESPSSSIDASGGGGLHDIQHGYDSDIEVGDELPDWSGSLSADELAALTKEEKKRQDLINEIFHTERYHLRKLKVLDKIFYGPLSHRKVLNAAEMDLVFANLDELLEIHTCFNSAMKAKRKENPLVGDIGEILLEMFDSTKGEELREAAASFCERQHLALELITERRRKDQRFETELSGCEKNRVCRRQNLQSFIPVEMQRISKYPLLLQRLLETTNKVYSERKNGDGKSQQKELERLRLALKRSKEIINHVNETAKLASNKSRLLHIQNHLDILIEKQSDSSNLRNEQQVFINEYKNIDLTKYSLIREDKVDLLRPGKSPMALLMLLFEEAVVFLLHENDRYNLKFIQSGAGNPLLAPIIKVPSLIVRQNAANTNTIFLLNFRAENTQMYELRAKSKSDRDVWFKQLSDAADAYNRRQETGSGITSTKSKPRTSDLSTTSLTSSSSTTTPPTPSSTGATPTSDDTLTTTTTTTTTAAGTPASGGEEETVQDLPHYPPQHHYHRRSNNSKRVTGYATKAAAGGSSSEDLTVGVTTGATGGDGRVTGDEHSDVDEEATEKRLSQTDSEGGVTAAASGGGTAHASTVGGGVMVKMEADDWSLVQPSEVQVAIPPVHTAQPVLTSLEKLKRKDEEVRQALADKKVLVADLLSIPLQHYHHIAEMASEESQKTADTEPSELVLAAVFQVDKLLKLMNESLNINETDPVLATGGKHPSCSSNASLVLEQQNNHHVPSVSLHQLESIVPLLSSQLTTLLSLTKQGEEEKVTLRKELQKTREQLHKNMLSGDQEEETFQQDFNQSGDLARIEESPTETDTT